MWLNATVTAKDVPFAKALYEPEKVILAGKIKDLGPVSPGEVPVPSGETKQRVSAYSTRDMRCLFFSYQAKGPDTVQRN